MGTMPGTDAHGHGDLVNAGVAHEHSDIDVRAVIWFAVGLIVTVGLVQVAMWAMLRSLDKVEVNDEPAVTPMAMPAGLPMPDPQLQTTPRVDLRSFREAEVQQLDNYGWVDQKAGVAHIPIEKAKELILLRGLPSRTAAGTEDASEGTHVAAGGEASGGRSIPAGGADKSSGPLAPPAPSPPPGAKPPTAKGRGGR